MTANLADKTSPEAAISRMDAVDKLDDTAINIAGIERKPRNAADLALAMVVIVAFSSVFIWNGVSSVDFGRHWDEEKLIFAIQKTINSAEIIPGWYNYPSLTYLICLITALTHFPAVSGADWSETVQKLSQYVDSTSFTHLLRAVFAILTASTALFAVLAARAVRAGSLSAAVSAAIVLASFEVFYHARWVAPDPLLMLAGAMTLATALWAARDQRLPVLLLSATCAGLATAAKYPGGCLLLLPLIVAARGPSFSSRAVCVAGRLHCNLSSGDSRNDCRSLALRSRRPFRDGALPQHRA
jgi:4-amino-4-deoxy-L-arabinose transferase-like glycosyltransferase